MTTDEKWAEVLATILRDLTGDILTIDQRPDPTVAKTELRMSAVRANQALRAFDARDSKHTLT